MCHLASRTPPTVFFSLLPIICSTAIVITETMLWPVSFVNILNVTSCMRSLSAHRCLILCVACRACVRACVWTVSGCNCFHNVELMQHFSLPPHFTEDYGPDYFPGKSLRHIPWCLYHFWTSARAQNFPSPSCTESPDAETPDSPPGTYQQQVRLQPVVRPNSPGTSGSTPTPPFLALGFV